MTISKDEASQALGEIEAATGRARRVVGYGRSSRFLMLWGLVWLVADSASQFAPHLYWTWPIATVVGAVISTALGFSQPREAGGAWRWLASWITVIGFIAALGFVLAPWTWRQGHSVFGLVFGFIYLVTGYWVGPRITLLGAALIALTLFGFYEVTGWYPLYMGLVGGGALILGGVWLRTI